MPRPTSHSKRTYHATTSHTGALRTIIAVKIFGGMLFLLISLGIFTLIDKDISDLAEKITTSLGIDPENHYLLRLLEWLTGISQTQIITIGLATSLYSTLLFIMAWGLYLGRIWAEWLTIGATGITIPIELYKILWSPNITYSITLTVNIFIVWYLVQRRLRAALPS